MKKDDYVYIEDILEAFNKICEYTKGQTEKDFYNNEMIQDAVIRKFEIAGEAVKNISTELKGKHSNVPWKKMAGMRDKLVHDYSGVDLIVLWETIQKLLPELIGNLSVVLNKK